MSLYPPDKPKMEPKDYEKVPVGSFVIGEISDIQHEANHQFKGEHAKNGPAVRIKFKIDGLKFAHGTPWMTFSYGKKANLYNKFVLPLVEGAEPFMNFDLESLKGFRVKMIWLTSPKNPDYQSISLVLPENDKKFKPTLPGILNKEDVSGDAQEDAEVPF